MFRLLKAFLKIYSELKRIREILEIIFKKELESYNFYNNKIKSSETLPKQDLEIDSSYFIQKDEYGKEVDPFEETNARMFNKENR